MLFISVIYNFKTFQKLILCDSYLFLVKYTPEPVHLFLVTDHNIFVKTKEMMDTPISVYFTNQTINGMYNQPYCFIFYLCYKLK